MRHRDAAAPHSDIKKHKHIVIVSGSPGYEDYDGFAQGVVDYLASREIVRGDVLFLAGDAYNGTDAMIAKWCVLNDYPFCLFPAAWDDISSDDAVVRYTEKGKAYNVLAGVWRNSDMAELANGLLTFYDGVSTGTKDMIKQMAALKHHVRCVIINTT